VSAGAARLGPRGGADARPPGFWGAVVRSHRPTTAVSVRLSDRRKLEGCCVGRHGSVGTTGPAPMSGSGRYGCACLIDRRTAQAIGHLARLLPAPPRAGGHLEWLSPDLLDAPWRSPDRHQKSGILGYRRARLSRPSRAGGGRWSG